MGRALIVHASASMRAHCAELITREGLKGETMDSTFRCMARFVEEPADLVVLGVGAIAESELELIRTLKREKNAPRILVTFPSIKRDMAVRALDAGADGYILEPFYADEFLGAVRGQLQKPAEPESSDILERFAHEVAHAVGNPLQVLELLLGKPRVTKKELAEGIPPHVERIQAVVGHLREYGAIADMRPEALDVVPVARRAAGAAKVEFHCDLEALVARADPQGYPTALDALFRALGARVAEGALVVARLTEEAGMAVLRATAPATAFEGEEPLRLPDLLFVVGPERDLRPGLALSRTLLERQGGSLLAEKRGAVVTFVAGVPV